MTLAAHHPGIINRGSLAYMLLESTQLVSHRLHRSARLARGLSVATTLQQAGKGPNSWICAQDTNSIPAERECTSLPAACLPARPKLLLLQGHLLSSPPPLGDRASSMSKWIDCTQPICPAATLIHTGGSHYTLSPNMRPRYRSAPFLFSAYHV